MDRSTFASGTGSTIPVLAGIGFRTEHFADVMASSNVCGWFEVHAENYFGSGGVPMRQLEAVRKTYPVSLHGVGLSLGSCDPLDRTQLERLKRLIDRIEPGLVSEHLSWGSFQGQYLNDLAPLPYTEESLVHLSERVQAVQDFLGCRILLENPSSYLEFKHSTMAEWEFLAELARRSGAGVLLDINNIYVSCRNHGWNPLSYLAGIPPQWVAELHLAGHDRQLVQAAELLIDTHDRPVCPEVWMLYADAVARFGPRPTLIEWDANLPPLSDLVAEAERANAILEASHALAA